MKKLILLVIVILLMMGSVVAAKPGFLSGEFTSGWFIKYPTQQYIKQGTDYNFNFHIFNSSDGIPVINGTYSFGDISCYFHLYNSSGNHIYTKKTLNEFDDIFDVEVLVSGDNFSKAGDYSYIFQCNNSMEGGFDSVELKVTNTGHEFTVAKSIYYSTLLFLLIFLFILTMYSITKLPDGNDTDDYGLVMSINNLKYLRPVLFAVGWTLLLLIVFTTSNVSIAYFNVDMFGTVMFRIYQIMMLITLPMAIIWMVYIFLNIFKDREVKRMLERGMDVPGGSSI